MTSPRVTVKGRMRLYCLVPHCQRYRMDRKNSPVADHHEWICREHWRAIPAQWRKIYRRAYQRLEDAESFAVDRGNGFISFASKQQLLEQARAYEACGRLWNRLKTFAIDCGMGLRA